MERLSPEGTPQRSVLRAVFGFPKSRCDHQSIQLSKPVFVSSPRGAVQTAEEREAVEKVVREAAGLFVRSSSCI